ncbi:glycosyl hydrolase family 18 protein [Sorangium sp. So ce1000]|uniref:glycosyl hydrolase family 18 protein n=1 Tax=Sorangium sp. So ce1000 TaxID=3133325 RepID=UPI003F6021E7
MSLHRNAIAPELSLLLVAITMSGLGCLASVSPEGEIDAAQNGSSVCADFPEWQEGQLYYAGDIVNYQGSAYIAKYDNPGYIPTVSTYYWEPYSGCSGSTEPTEPTEPTEGSCGYPQWQEGQLYYAGDIVNYQGSAYIAKYDNPGYIPTVSTYYWEPYSGCSGSPGEGGSPGAGGSPSAGGGLPAKVVAGYYPNWTEAPVRIRDINSNYNVIYLFAATPVGGSPGTTGAVEWMAPKDGRGAATNLNADIQYARTNQGRKIILSIGGAGNGMSFPTRAKSETFVESVVGIYDSLGGFDGIDWNTFEANQAPDTSEMIWISKELKQRFPGFIITAPPAPWNNRDKTFCKEMVDAGAMDYAAPQYYDGPDLDQQSYIVNSVNEWVSLLGPTHVVVGFGIWDQPYYMSIDEAIPTWNEVESNHPKLRGVFDWQIHIDESLGWQFANGVGPLVTD